MEAVELDVKNIDIDTHDIIEIIEPELASFHLSLTQLVTHEDGSLVAFSLALGSQAIADVVVTLYVSDDSGGRVNKSTLSFNADNWAQAQVVTVTPVAAAWSMRIKITS